MPPRTSAKAKTQSQQEAAKTAAKSPPVLVGNLTQDPELQFTPSGLPVTNLRMAVTPRVQNESGEWLDGETKFYDVIAWRQLAEHCAESLVKGSRIVATGRWKKQEWEDKQTGEARHKWQLVASDVGASLMFATATVRKASRYNAASDDGQTYSDDEPPF